MKLFTIKKKPSSKDLAPAATAATTTVPLNKMEFSTPSPPKPGAYMLENSSQLEINHSQFDDKSGEDHSSHEILASTGSEFTHPEKPMSKKGLSCIYTIHFLELFYSDETRQQLASLPNYQTVKLPQKILLSWRRHVNMFVVLFFCIVVLMLFK